MENKGTEAWAMLHGYALQYPEQPTKEDQRKARQWLKEWEQFIPVYGCACLAKWQRLLLLAPPDLSNRDAFHTWTVVAHDRVNHDLGKPLFAPETSMPHAMFRDIRHRIDTAPINVEKFLGHQNGSSVGAHWRQLAMRCNPGTFIRFMGGSLSDERLHPARTE